MVEQGEISWGSRQDYAIVPMLRNWILHQGNDVFVISGDHLRFFWEMDPEGLKVD